MKNTKPNAKKQWVMTPEHKAKCLLNLQKAHLVQAQAIIRANPQALKHIPAPPLPDLENSGSTDNLNLTSSVTDPAIRRRSLRTRLDRYIGGIDSVRDFERVRKHNPRFALEFAADRVWGRPQQQGSGAPAAGSGVVAMLVKVLCGIDHKGTTVPPAGLPAGESTQDITADITAISITSEPNVL